VAALSALTPTRTGTASAGAAVAASDTVSVNQLGVNGAWLEIINGNASTDNMTITDAGSTPAGNALSGGTYPVSVTNATSKIFYLSPKQADPVNGITITHSVTSTVTYKLYPLG
jgi:L-ascorbate metabolism protein UlaG (beta-lactamase superfamily)